MKRKMKGGYAHALKSDADKELSSIERCDY